MIGRQVTNCYQPAHTGILDAKLKIGTHAYALITRDRKVLSPSATRDDPLVVDHGEGAVIQDVDGNRFLDFNAGIAVAATGHCHPQVVKAIDRQAARLIHMSGTDFYYENMVQL